MLFIAPFIPTVSHSKWECIGLGMMRAYKGDSEEGGGAGVVGRADLTQLNGSSLTQTPGSGSKAHTSTLDHADSRSLLIQNRK